MEVSNLGEWVQAPLICNSLATEREAVIAQPVLEFYSEPTIVSMNRLSYPLYQDKTQESSGLVKAPPTEHDARLFTPSDTATFHCQTTKG